MAYGFNADKTKAKVFSQDDILTFEIALGTLNANSTGSKAFTSAQLAQLSEWADGEYFNIFVTQNYLSTNSSGGYQRMDNETPMYVVSNGVYPRVEIQQNEYGDMDIYTGYAKGYNPTDSARSVFVRVTFIKGLTYFN